MHYDNDMLYIEQMEKGEKLYHYTTIDALINIVSKKVRLLVDEIHLL